MDRLTVIHLKPSRIAVYVHNIAWLLSVTALWLCGLPVWLKLLLTAVLLYITVRQHNRQKMLPLSAIGFEQEQWWALVQNHKTAVELVNEQLVLPWLMVLNFRVNTSGQKISGNTYALALWPDMAESDDLRRLRVFLRYHK